MYSSTFYNGSYPLPPEVDVANEVE